MSDDPETFKRFRVAVPVAVISSMPEISVLLSPTMFPFAAILLVTVTVSNVGVFVKVIVEPAPDADAVKLELTKLILPTLFADPTMVPSSLMVIPDTAPTT